MPIFKSYFFEISGTVPSSLVFPQSGTVREISIQGSLTSAAAAFAGVYAVRQVATFGPSELPNERVLAGFQLEIQASGQVVNTQVVHPNAKFLATEKLWLYPTTSAGSLRSNMVVIVEYQ